MVVVVADDARHLPCAILVLPQRHKLGVPHLWGARQEVLVGHREPPLEDLATLWLDTTLILSNTDRLTAYTDEELEHALARVLAQARGEVLNDAEVQKFWQLYEEIQRRALSVTAA